MSKESDCSSALDVSNLTILDLHEFIENDNPYFKESPWWRQNTSVEFLDDDEPPQPEFIEFIFQNFAEVCFQVLGGSKKFYTTEDVYDEIRKDLDNFFEGDGGETKYYVDLCYDINGDHVEGDDITEFDVEFLLDWLVQNNRAKKYRCNTSQEVYYCTVNSIEKKNRDDQDDEMEEAEPNPPQPGNPAIPNSFRRSSPTEFATATEATSSGYRKRQARAAAAPLVADAGEGSSSQAAKKPRMDQASSPSATPSTPASSSMTELDLEEEELYQNFQNMNIY